MFFQMRILSINNSEGMSDRLLVSLSGDVQPDTESDKKKKDSGKKAKKK